LYLADHLKETLQKPDFRTLIEQSVKDWPALSCIIVL
jgi:hypothetical protein